MTLSAADNISSLLCVRCIKAVVSDSAFSVPPQQLITNDGGIIEIGAEVQYGITDVVVMVREVADHQDILRSDIASYSAPSQSSVSCQLI